MVIFFEIPDLRMFFYVFRNREAANILIDFLFLLNLGFSSQHVRSRCDQTLDWCQSYGSNKVISIKDSFIVGECIRVHDNKAVDNPVKPKDIDNW